MINKINTQYYSCYSLVVCLRGPPPPCKGFGEGENKYMPVLSEIDDPNASEPEDDGSTCILY